MASGFNAIEVGEGPVLPGLPNLVSEEVREQFPKELTEQFDRLNESQDAELVANWTSHKGPDIQHLVENCKIELNEEEAQKIPAINLGLLFFTGLGVINSASFTSLQLLNLTLLAGLAAKLEVVKTEISRGDHPVAVLLRAFSEDGDVSPEDRIAGQYELEQAIDDEIILPLFDGVRRLACCTLENPPPLLDLIPKGVKERCSMRLQSRLTELNREQNKEIVAAWPTEDGPNFRCLVEKCNISVREGEIEALRGALEASYDLPGLEVSSFGKLTDQNLWDLNLLSGLYKKLSVLRDEIFGGNHPIATVLDSVRGLKNLSDKEREDEVKRMKGEIEKDLFGALYARAGKIIHGE